MLRNYNKCYVERALTYLCMQSMVLPIEPAGGEVRKGSRAERKHTFSACFFLTDAFTTSAPSKYNAANSWSSAKVSSITFWWQLTYFSPNCGRRPGWCDSVTVHGDAGETFEPTPVNGWCTYQLLLSWQTDPVSAEASNFWWRLTGVISGLLCFERLEARALTTPAFNPVCYLDMGKLFAFSHLSWTLSPHL